jgi:hypothetical protein
MTMVNNTLMLRCEWATPASLEASAGSRASVSFEAREVRGHLRMREDI